MANERRRANERRDERVNLEPLERKRQRRREERRASPRIEHPLYVQGAGTKGVVMVQGEFGLGGASWKSTEAVPGNALQVSIRPWPATGEIKLQGSVLQKKRVGAATLVRVAFTDLALKAELALAKYLDELIQTNSAAKPQNVGT